MGELMGAEVIRPINSGLEEEKIKDIKFAILDEIMEIVNDENFLNDDLRKEADDIDIDKVTIEYLSNFSKALKDASGDDSYKYTFSASIDREGIKSEEEGEKIKKFFWAQ